jgi:hypothetical protein
MAITLDGIQLPDMLLDPDPDLVPRIRSSTEFSLGLRPLVWEGSMNGGRAFDLVALPDQGWGPTGTSEGLTRANLEAIWAKSDTPGWSGILTYETRTFRVRFRHEESPAIEVEPIVPRPNQASGDYYYGRIKLMEV